MWIGSVYAAAMSSRTPETLYVSSIPSGNAYKVQLLAHQLGVPLRTVELDILATPPQTRSREFLAKNPNGKIPLLEFSDGSVLAESNAICHYLAQSQGTPLWPAGTFEQSRVLQWLFFEQYSHEPNIAVLKFHTLWGDLDRCRPEQIETWRSRGNHALDVMETHLRAHTFFVASSYSIADIALFAYTQSVEEFGFSLADRPAIRAWLERVRREPGFVPIPS